MVLLNKFAVLEGILFAWGEPLKLGEIAEVLQVSNSECKALLEEFDTLLKEKNRGIRLVHIENSYQLSTKPEIFDRISDYARNTRQKALSNAAMETLSIIAYRQPIIKSDIEEIRGVKCDQVLKNLQEVDLVEIKGRLESPGRPNIFGTTEFFLKKFGLQSLDELPRREEDIEEFNFLEG